MINIFRKSPDMIPQHLDKLMGKLNGEKNICIDHHKLAITNYL